MSPQTPSPSLDTLLAGLRNAQPSPDFQTRLLTHLEAASEHPCPQLPRHPQLLRRPRLPRPAVLAPFVVGLAAVLLLVFLLPRAHTPQPTTALQTHPAPLAPKTPPAATVAQSPTLTPPARHLRSRPAPTLAEVETAAPSLPPPSLQLTAEERNIKRFRSLHTAVSLAALSPAAIDAHQAADQRDLQSFFDPNHQEN